MRRHHQQHPRGAQGGGGGSASQHQDTPPLETVVARLETTSRLLHAVGRNSNTTRPDEIYEEIGILTQDLTRVGVHLEAAYPDVLDRVISSMRDASAHPSLPPSLRLAIFQLVELRAAKWNLPTDTTQYYRQRRHLNADAVDLEDGNVATCSGAGRGTSPSLTITTPTPPTPGIDSNKTFRQEILIKNADSGKVMGVRGRRVHLIEALSDTIISFEKVNAAAKERVLSINGYSHQSINMAKQLIQDTIARNASPVFDDISGEIGNSIEAGTVVVDGVTRDVEQLSFVSKPEEVSQFSYSVHLGDDVIKITGNNLHFVQEAKLTLDEYFCQKYPELFYLSSTASAAAADILPIGRWKYDRETLMKYAALGNCCPPDFSHLESSIRENIILKKRRGWNAEILAGPSCAKPRTTDAPPS